MTDYSNLRPVSTDGTELDATFDLARESVFSVTYHHKAGARGGPRSVNADYHRGLELLLERLASLGAEILDISVDSSVARKLEPPDRRLDLNFPICLEFGMKTRELRMQITRAQRTVARRPGVQPVGGNDQKTVRITLSCHVSLEKLRTVLVGDGNRGKPSKAHAP
jgi:hypothetical protein